MFAGSANTSLKAGAGWKIDVTRAGLIAMAGMVIGAWAGWRVATLERDYKIAVAIHAELDRLEEWAKAVRAQAERYETIRLRLCAFPFTYDNIMYLQKRGEIENYC